MSGNAMTDTPPLTPPAYYPPHITSALLATSLADLADALIMRLMGLPEIDPRDARHLVLLFRVGGRALAQSNPCTNGATALAPPTT